MAAKKNMPEDPYERLANAIVIQAAEDYRAHLSGSDAIPRTGTRLMKPCR